MLHTLEQELIEYSGKVNPMNPAAINALQNVPFFSNLNRSELAIISQALVKRRFRSDQIIFHHGDPGGLLYIISKGKVKIMHGSTDGQEALLAILGKDAFFGELALLDEYPRSATVEAIEATETWTLHRNDFINFLDNNHEFTLHVLHTMAQNIRRMNTQLSDLFFLDLPARLARVLLSLAEQHGAITPDGILIDLSLTQTDLAEMTGATRVSINKALGRFRRAGWLNVKSRNITILDHSALTEVIRLAGGSIQEDDKW